MGRYKKLIVSGCSFTIEYSWANRLAEYLGAELVNLAVAGAGPQHTTNSIRLYLEQNSVDKESTLIVPMWSGIIRKDWIVDVEEKYEQLNLLSYKYTEPTRLVNPANALHKLGLSRMILRFVGTAKLPDLIELAYSHKPNSQSVVSWLSIDHLNQFLTANGYNYFQMSWYDHTTGAPNNNPMLRGTNYVEHLAPSNLNINFPKWITFDGDNLGNWCYKNNLSEDDDVAHPKMRGHIAWAEQILIPQLTNLGIIDSKSID